MGCEVNKEIQGVAMSIGLGSIGFQWLGYHGIRDNKKSHNQDEYYL